MLDQILIIIPTISENITWLVVLIVFVFIMIDAGKRSWLVALNRKTLANIKWVMLEIKIPKENTKSPKAMEQVFSSLHGTYSFGIKWIDKWWFGKLEEWLSLEMVGSAQGIRFYAYLPERNRNLLEASLLSQYPEAEIHETEDYIDRFGNDLPNDVHDLFGTDFMLDKDNHFPLKTYQFFEDIEEERRLDSLATVFEAISVLKDDEMIWLQLLIKPTGSVLEDGKEKLISQMTGKPAKASSSGLGDYFANFLGGLVAALESSELSKKKGDDKSAAIRITPGQQDILKEVENKASKLVFETILRFIYIDRKDSFTPSNVTAIMGAMRQFSTQNLNSLRPNLSTLTVPRLVGKIFRKRRLLKRKEKLFQSYCKREMPFEPKMPFTLRLKTSVLSVEELATLYHPPATAVGAPSLKPLEAKKGSAPTNLPIVENYK